MAYYLFPMYSSFLIMSVKGKHTKLVIEVNILMAL